MQVKLVGYTEFINPFVDPVDGGLEWDAWTTDACGGQALAEYAGRACYQSWSKPNPKTATNAGYLDHIREIGHESVLEHGVMSFNIEGVSRSLSHELIRHRHLSPSQLSQRYVPNGGVFIEPAVIAEDPELHELFMLATITAGNVYDELRDKLELKFAHLPDNTSKKKQARQAARSVLPNATETKLVMTGNYRAWRHFIDLRASEHADVEIRELAIHILRLSLVVAPNVFNDFEIVELDDGTEVAVR